MGSIGPSLSDQRDAETAVMMSEMLRETRSEVDAALERACRFPPGCPERLANAMRYALLAPGKRLRPILVLWAAEACGGDRAEAMPAAVAVEMIHAYSLVHDDLPSMDDDDLRRGRATTHVQYDESTAILAGDALQAEAFAHLVSNVPDQRLAAQLVSELAAAAGAAGLVGGQVDDLAAEAIAPTSFDASEKAIGWLASIHQRKTGALFTACLRMGGRTAGAAPEVLDALTGYAANFGLAFQITDDLLDVTASDEQLGKRTQKDAARGKWTYPGLMAAAAGPTETDADARRGSVYESGELSDTPLSVGVERARQRAEELIEAAKAALALLGPPAVRLDRLADHILERTN